MIEAVCNANNTTGICGDGICDTIDDENCTSCLLDCGLCGTIIYFYLLNDDINLLQERLNVRGILRAVVMANVTMVYAYAIMDFMGTFVIQKVFFT